MEAKTVAEAKVLLADITACKDCGFAVEEYIESVKDDKLDLWMNTYQKRCLNKDVFTEPISQRIVGTVTLPTSIGRGFFQL
jgi:hypothetical protein